MLPDYPKTKALWAESNRERIRRAHDAELGVFANVQVTQLHEGGKLILVREDGSMSETPMKRVEATVELEVDVRQLEELDAKDVGKMLDSMGEKLAAKKGRTFIDCIDAGVRSVGNVTDPSKSTLEQFFEGLEKVQLEFDDRGNPPEMQYVVGSEETAQKIEEIISQIESNPTLRRRREDIIQKKKEEWRDREAARNLVE